MTDLEITKLCAEAMGLELLRILPTDTMCFVRKGVEDGGAWDYDYWPLRDDAQAMELVKKFRLAVEYQGLPSSANWHVTGSMYSCNASLNRAICECVAKMQKRPDAAPQPAEEGK